MRCDQVIGLNERATPFTTGERVLDCYMISVTEHLDGTKGEPVRSEVFRSTCLSIPSGNKFSGMYESSYDLEKYIHDDGREYTEFVQAEPWASGPCFFLALKDKDGNVVKETLWTDEEIRDNA